MKKFTHELFLILVFLFSLSLLAFLPVEHLVKTFFGNIKCRCAHKRHQIFNSVLIIKGMYLWIRQVVVKFTLRIWKMIWIGKLLPRLMFARLFSFMPSFPVQLDRLSDKIWHDIIVGICKSWNSNQYFCSKEFQIAGFCNGLPVSG